MGEPNSLVHAAAVHDGQRSSHGSESKRRTGCARRKPRSVHLGVSTAAPPKQVVGLEKLGLIGYSMLHGAYYTDIGATSSAPARRKGADGRQLGATRRRDGECD